MRALQIATEGGRLYPMAHFVVYSTMIYPSPHDDRRRKELILALSADALRSWPNRHSDDDGLDLPKLPQEHARENFLKLRLFDLGATGAAKQFPIKERFNQGLLAGGMLLDLVSLGNSNHPASVRKVTKLQADRKVGLAVVRHRLREVWPQFSSISHFYAAVILRLTTTSRCGFFEEMRSINPAAMSLLAPTELLVVIAIAEKLREMAAPHMQTSFASRAKRTEIDWWISPPNVPLPRVDITPAKFDLSSEAVIKALRQS